MLSIHSLEGCARTVARKHTRKAWKVMPGTESIFFCGQRLPRSQVSNFEKRARPLQVDSLVMSENCEVGPETNGLLSPVYVPVAVLNVRKEADEKRQKQVAAIPLVALS